MENHRGQIVEKTIRRNGYSISELARHLNVNRRSIYNWFNQQYLKPEIIFRIGCALRHDFSTEFPHLFPNGEFKMMNQLSRMDIDEEIFPEHVNPGIWKEKYILLLEKYNELLLTQLKKRRLSAEGAV